MPKVSVVMPVFNAERYLSEAIESIRGQSLADFELLLVDDGSTDGSAAIAKQSAAKDPRLVFIQGEHHGVVHCRNAGVNLARCEFVAMMDSDDVSATDRLERQVRFLEAHAECCAVGAQAVRIDPDGAPIDFWRVPETHEEIDANHLRTASGCIVNPSVMMRRSVVLRVGGYRSGFDSSEDYDLFLRLAEIGRLANLPDILLRYRLHAKSLTLSRAEIQRQLAQKALEEAWVRRKMPGLAPVSADPPKTQSEEELTWSWAKSAFASRNYATARKHAFRLLLRRPFESRRWILFGAACLGPVGSQLRRVCRYRVGQYQSPAKP